MNRRVLISGANGFVGRVLIRALIAQGNEVTGLVRRSRPAIQGVREWVLDSNAFIGAAEQWPSGLTPDVFIHLAARVHLLHDTAKDQLAAYRETNVAGTLRLAAASHKAGAQRFVFVSSAKAAGESDHGRPLSESDVPAPTDPYGISKLEAECALREFARQSGMEVVIVRPPLVYGPEVRANFLQLMQAVARGIPLPLGRIHARRSLVFVGNLASAVGRCASDPRAAGQTFHVTDAHDLSVTELARALAGALNVPSRLLPVPIWVLKSAGTLTGRTEQVDRLVGSLQLDASRIRGVLDWRPPYSVEEGIAATAAWYRSTH